MHINGQNQQLNGLDKQQGKGGNKHANRVMDSMASMSQEDSDVRQERIEVSQTDTSELVSKDIVLYLKDLMKVYSGKFTAVDKLFLKVN